MFHVPNQYRVKNGFMGSTDAIGNNGQFVVKSLKLKNSLNCQASDGMGWEHVSVSRPDRCPTWEEMCFIKSLFWDSEDRVVQFHPPESEYINDHPYVLHLWRKTNTNDFCETPCKILV